MTKSMSPRYRSDDDDGDDEAGDGASSTEADVNMSLDVDSVSASPKMIQNQYEALLAYRRPKRQRTSTTFYTDENPSTHTYPTAKVKREEEAAARVAAAAETQPFSAAKSSSRTSVPSSKWRARSYSRSSSNVSAASSRASNTSDPTPNGRKRGRTPTKRTPSAAPANKAESKPKQRQSRPKSSARLSSASTVPSGTLSVSEYARTYNRSPTSSRRRDSTSSLATSNSVTTNERTRSIESSSTPATPRSKSRRQKDRHGRKRNMSLPTHAKSDEWHADIEDERANIRSSRHSLTSSMSSEVAAPQDAYSRSRGQSQRRHSSSSRRANANSDYGRSTNDTGRPSLRRKSTTSTTENSTASGSSATTLPAGTKRRGRPSSKKNRSDGQRHATSTSGHSPEQHQSPTASKSKQESASIASRSLQQQHHPSRTVVGSSSQPAASDSTERSCEPDSLRAKSLNHSICIKPILPTTVQHDSNCTLSTRKSLSTVADLEQAYPRLFRRSACPIRELDNPYWDDIYEPPIYYNRDYEGDDHSITDQSDDDGDLAGAVESDTPFRCPTGPCSPVGARASRRRRRVRTLDMDTPPVVRSVSCLAMRVPDNEYLAMGDTAGFVTIYAMNPVIRPIQRLESVACAEDRSYTHQQSIRSQMQNKKKHVRARDTPQTTIQAMSMVRSRIVLATACELECMDVMSASSLWVFPFDPARRQVVSLDMHPTSYDVLVSCRMTKLGVNASTPVPEDDEAHSAVAAMPGPVSPMLVLKHAHGNIEICDANSPSLVKSPFCTAIWDRSVIFSSDESTTQLLLCAPMADDTNDWKLILLQGGSIDQWKVKTKTKIPSVTNVSGNGTASSTSGTFGNGSLGTSVTNNSSNGSAGGGILTLRQSPKGRYTFVVSARGIRLFQTKTLALLHVYGDQLALHGRSIVWQDVVLMGKAPVQQYGRGDPQNRRFHVQKDGTIECPEVLSAWSDSIGFDPGKTILDGCIQKDDNDDDLGQFIIGVPHPTKGPTELCEALHVWNTNQATSVPLLHLPLPELSGGVRSLVASTNRSAITGGTGLGDRLILATQRGDCRQWVPNIASDFAGIMYPPGYQVVRNNMEYIEDEDELDMPVSGSPTVMATAFVDQKMYEAAEKAQDADLQEGLRRSMHHQQHGPFPSHDFSTIDDEEDVVVVINDAETFPVDGDSSTQTNGNDAAMTETISCRPEPYLRQMINRGDGNEGDVRSGMKSNMNCKNGDKSHRNQFISSILDALPSKKPVPEPKQPPGAETFTFTTTTITLIANDPKSNNASGSDASSNVNPSKVSRGRRSRASNLKASIDPRLQAYMSSSQRQWRDGSGSSLVFPPAPPKSAQKVVAEAPVAAGKADGDDDAITTNPDKKKVVAMAAADSAEPSNTAIAETIVATDASGRVQVDQARIVSDSSETNGTDAENAKQKVAIPANGAQQQPQPMAVVHADRPTSAGGQLRVNTAQAPVSALLAVPAPAATQAQSTQNGDGKSTKSEQAAIFALLGLSPSNAMQSESEAGTVSSAPSAVSVGGVPNARLNHTSPPTSPSAKLDPSCAACMGRMVIHSCGKRSLPIDYDEVIRKERLRREKAEEERKRIQKEKRRLADARRREARKQKLREMEERKRVQEEYERIEKERRRRLDMASYKASSNYVDDRNRDIGFSDAYGVKTPAVAGYAISGYNDTTYEERNVPHASSALSSVSRQVDHSYERTARAPGLYVNDPHPSGRERSVASRQEQASLAASATAESRSYLQMPAAQSFVQQLSSAMSGNASALQERAYSLIEHRQYQAYARQRQQQEKDGRGQASQDLARDNSRDTAPASWSKASITGTSDDYGQNNTSANGRQRASSQCAAIVSRAPASTAVFTSGQPSDGVSSTNRPARSASSGTLSSAEGLAALASLAGQSSSIGFGRSATAPVTAAMKSPAAYGRSMEERRAPVSFNTARAPSSTVSIPSYEAIRTEQNGLGDNGFVQGYNTK